MIIALAVLLLIGITWGILRKKRKAAMSISILLIIVYAAGYVYYPVYKEQTHAKRYSEMIAYLGATYPEETFSVRPEKYEEGVTVGRFNIARAGTPEMGVTMKVDQDGHVIQTGTWTDKAAPEQEELWREIRFIRSPGYSLDQELPEVQKVDQLIDGDLTVFALEINQAPAIAVFNYNQGGYSLLAFEEGHKNEFVQAESEGYLYVYIDKAFKRDRIDLLNREGETLDISGQKGMLIVKK
ncbi:hypothetical protein [Jeotgalibacillus haloalkalitolerans]|uniref:Uncharacterized protein n=1 Tax=Jeotgalibacillus haloalkalitolerans TaxID=3104292 RepID=A0ABU5KNH0_9BACL|nr:hypothetical protein [Jeotgalibacillus sp. HH7-29]MDZ5712804.1 hypothetical protein [Jeotgalibacillus sp. HH7-29]